MRDDHYAYVHFAGLEPLLFDLRSDPHWLSNVAEDPAPREAALRYARKLLAWRAELIGLIEAEREEFLAAQAASKG